LIGRLFIAATASDQRQSSLKGLGIERVAEILTEWYLAEPNDAAEIGAD